MSVNTVCGKIDDDELGITQTHEHIFVDTTKLFADKEIKETSTRNLFKQRVCISNLGNLRFNAASVLDNVILSDTNLAIKEVLEYKKYGGKTVLDQTNEEMGRDPISLQNISRITGINIIASTGYYLQGLHPSYIEEKSEAEIAKIMIKEITQGIGNTGICAGSIGEIGTNREITRNELKVLKSSASAQKKTNAPLFIHTWPWGENGNEIINILKEKDANLNKVVICHVDGVINISYYENLINEGVFIEFDLFGQEWGYCDICDGDVFFTARDIDRINAIKELIKINQSYIKNILISSDVNLKINLINYGGYGYAHILKNIIPIMKKQEITSKEINTLIVENPKRLLSIN